MKRITSVIVLLIAQSVAHAGDPAWPGNHPLTQAQAGSVLISELRCAACHAGVQTHAVPDKTAPNLVDVGTRISPEFLQQFLESPSAAHPGTTMPDVLGSRSESERHAIAEALTHFLVALSTPNIPSEPTGPIDRQQGELLFHSIGCVACHGPMESRPTAPLESESVDDDEVDESTDPARTARKAIKPDAVPLAHVAAKYSVKSLSDFLFEPLRVRSSGRMPDMKLTPAEALAIAGYLTGVPARPNTVLTPDAALIEAGKKHFQALNCAACHALPGIPTPAPKGSLKTAGLSGGCLSKSPETTASLRGPRYDLDDQQRAAIAAALREESPDDSDQVSVAKTLTAFRCVACHVRDDFGGVHDAHNPFFKGSELNMGDDGRMPPPLTWIGAKLKPSWMKKVLFDGESVRHYMVTRMPQYGTNNLQHLPGLFRQLDVLAGPEMKIPNPESRTESEREHEKQIRAAGRELLGDKAANCVACHQFNGKAANVNQGIDLLTSYERLQPEWFNRYLRNPGAFRPRTVMPSAWPDGVSAFSSILEGDSDRQIEAIWYYLSLGTSAADPSGVRAVNTKIEVGDDARVHRGRSRVAGFRGIAVGLPEKISYAFNAETGTLSAIWIGDFIGVNWSGQGSGDFNPASEPMTLSQDVSFTQLADENTPWPLLPAMTKEAPTNPNPLYPKNVGYQFRGYFLDERSIPTFMYRSGTIEIEDRSVAVGNEEQPQLLRHLQFESPTPQTIWFRALVGGIRRESENAVRLGRLRLILPPIESKLRWISEETNQSELLLRLDLPQGKSTLEFTYEPLPK
jgi:mono/diheme cytochrome c family protein